MSVPQQTELVIVLLVVVLVVVILVVLLLVVVLSFWDVCSSTDWVSSSVISIGVISSSVII